jgi:hypothetical protein
LTHKNEVSSKKLEEKLRVLTERNQLLEEELQLQRTNWLYSHYLSLSVCIGIVYGAAVASLIYIGEYLIFHSIFLRTFYTILATFVYFAIPSIAVFLLILLVKAPGLAFNSLRIYVFSFWLFLSLIFYLDPGQRVTWIYHGVEKVYYAVLFSATTTISIAISFLFVPQVAQRCGYRLVLKGSALSFEIDSDLPKVSEQLSKLEEDFNLVLDKSSSKPDRLFFAKSHGGQKTVLQFFLRSKENVTDVVLVAHSIRNDIPMRTGYKEFVRIGKSLLKWLEVSGSFTIHETDNESLITEMIEESEKSFYRRPVVLPSKEIIGEFLIDHYKDIMIIVSVVVAILAWLFPLER